MASSDDVDEVRQNADIDPDDDTYTFAVIGSWVDALGIAGATAKAWEKKAAAWAGLADISEAGAMERLGQLSASARAQAKYWNDKVAAEVVIETDDAAGRAKTSAITRPVG